MKLKPKNLLHFLLLAIIILLAYYNSLSNGFFGGDDINGIINNQNIGNINTVFSQPIAFVPRLIWALVVNFVGVNPTVFHSLNIIFHTATTLSIYILILLLTKKSALALFTSGFFAVHPILSEPVGWISAASYTQYGLFIITSLIMYSLSKTKSNLYILSIVFFTISLFISEKALVFPLIILLYDYCYTKKKFNFKRLLPFILVSALYIFLLLPSVDKHVEYYKNGQTISEIVRNPLTHVPLVVGTYIKLIFHPRNLYPHFKKSFTTIEYLTNLTLFTALLASIVYSFKKAKHIFFWLTFFLINLIPTTLPIGINPNFAERYVYLGSIGIFFSLSYVLLKLAKRIGDKNISYVAFGTIIIILILITHNDNKDLQNEITFNESRTKEFPNDPLAHFDLGERYAENNDNQSAKREHYKAIKLDPSFLASYDRLVSILIAENQTDQAIDLYKDYILISPGDPNLWFAYSELGKLYADNNNFELAEENLKKALLLNENNDIIYLDLSNLYSDTNKKERAKEILIEGLKITSSDKIKSKLETIQ